MAADEDLQQIFGGRRAKPLHADILEEEIDLREALHEIAPLSGSFRLGTSCSARGLRPM